MHPLQTLFVEAGLKPRSYSGRGMMGRECLSVNVDRGGLGTFMAGVVRAVAESFTSSGGSIGSKPESDVDHEEIADALENLTTDSMGLGMVVYFPGVPFEGSEDDDEEDDDEEDDG